MGLCPQTILPVLLQFGVHTAKPILAGEEIQVEDVHDTPEDSLLPDSSEGDPLF